MSMTFVRTDQGRVNLRSVVALRLVKVTPTKSNPLKQRTLVKYFDGEQVSTTLADADADELNSLCAPVVAATPGYSVVDVYDSEPFDLHYMPIVAWRITGRDYAEPICVDGLPSDSAMAIVDPSGRVTVPAMCRYESVEAYRAERIEEIKAKRATQP